MPYSVWPSAATRATPASAGVTLLPSVGALALAGKVPAIVVSGDPYSTSFGNTENPISEGGIWVNGGDTGLDWQNVRTSGGLAFGVGPSAGYDDCIAMLNLAAISTTKHYAEVTIHLQNGYSPPSTQEIQVHVGCNISAHNIFTYEFIIGSGLVRWQGVVGDFTLQGLSTSNLGGAKPWTDSPTINTGYAVADGDVFRSEYDASSGTPTITLKRNGVAFFQVQDTSAYKITSGRPAMAFFARSGSGLDMSAQSTSDFTAGSL